MNHQAIQIDLNEEFDHLPGAPIVEAVIHWRARAEQKVDPDEFLNALQEKLPDYPKSQRQQEIGFRSELGPEASSLHQHQIWHGFRFESEDKLHIAQFTRNGFVFSRLKPYEDWNRFEQEARRLWRMYLELAKPSEIQRLGVRFINRITPASPDELSDLLTVPPSSAPKMPLPLKGFMHQNTFDIPGHPYNLSVIQTIQPPSSTQTEAFGLILDLDIFTTKPMECDDTIMDKRLLEMRCIKNLAFFSLLKEKAIAQFRE